MEMTKEDKALFSFDLMTGFNWRDYLEKYVQVCLKNDILILPNLGLDLLKKCTNEMKCCIANPF